MIIGSNQQLIIIITYNDTGTAGSTLILSGSISEKAWDLLDAYSGYRYYRRHGSLRYSYHRSIPGGSISRSLVRLALLG